MRRTGALGGVALGALVVIGLTAPGAAAAPATGDPTTPTPGCATASAPAPGVAVETIDSDGSGREYRLAVPADAAATEPLPLILNFHGYGSDAVQQAIYSELEEQGPARGYAVATPQGTGDPAFWNIIGLPTPDDVARAAVWLGWSTTRRNHGTWVPTQPLQRGPSHPRQDRGGGY